MSTYYKNMVYTITIFKTPHRGPVHANLLSYIQKRFVSLSLLITDLTSKYPSAI